MVPKMCSQFILAIAPFKMYPFYLQQSSLQIVSIIFSNLKLHAKTSSKQQASQLLNATIFFKFLQSMLH